MSVKDNNCKIILQNSTTLDNLILDMNNDFDSKIILSDVSIQDLKILDFIHKSLDNNFGITISKSFKPMGF